LLFRNVDTEGTDCVTFGPRQKDARKQADGTRGSNTDSGGSDKATAIVVDVIGRRDRIHWLIS